MTTYAYLNHGRWVAECVCGGAERIWPGGQIQTDPKTGQQYGLASDGRMICGDKEFCGIESTVVVPTERERTDIHKTVGIRPDPRTRNWLPGETVGELLAENVDSLTQAIGS